MTLEKAISYVIDQEGIDIISNAKLKNFLNDLQAYDTPAIKRIVSTMVDDGYIRKLQISLANEDYELQFNDVANRLVQGEGFQADIVSYVMDCILFAVHKTNNVPIMPQKEIVKKPLVKKTTAVKNDLNVIPTTGNYLIEFNGHSYELNESQYKAIMRKKEMPADRLEVWLSSYDEENN